MNQRLYRSRSDRIIGGVAAGIADYVNADPALVRVVWAILVVVTGGVALVAYIVAWIVVPEAPATPIASAEPATDPVTGEVTPTPVSGVPASSDPSGSAGRAGVVVGIGLVLIGAWFLIRPYLPDIDWSLLWPLVLVGIGAVILFTSMRRRDG
jgi:phage shock protein C